jgi:hypothetical protein
VNKRKLSGTSLDGGTQFIRAKKDLKFALVLLQISFMLALCYVFSICLERIETLQNICLFTNLENGTKNDKS